MLKKKKQKPEIKNELILMCRKTLTETATMATNMMQTINFTDMINMDFC